MIRSERDSRWIYAIALTVATCALSFLLYQAGGSSTNSLTITFIGVLAAITRRSLLLQAVPLSVFGAMNYEFLRFEVNESQWLPFALLGFIAIAASMRLVSLKETSLQQAVTQRLVYTHLPTKTSNKFSPSHLITILCFASAWLLAGFLIADFRLVTSDLNKFRSFKSMLDRTIGLDPGAYVGIKITLILAMLFAVTYGLLSYLAIRNTNSLYPRLALRFELWHWNGPDQKRIAKQ